ncbi:probable salivary secreted peptide [Leptopilina heterotoma]|uniref:probable salivary secreted peptide n=1 Tax=Leptopilina heterotoma TaxID=63436 RepID=UPI001CA9C298|nr:probable salivary secreted peptide [Leptopilina heterotoma]
MTFEKSIVFLFVTSLILIVNIWPITADKHSNNNNNINNEDKEKPNNSHNLIIGSRQPGDKLYIDLNVTAPAIKSKIVIKSATYFIHLGHNITQIAAVDWKTDGTGADVTLESGSVEENNFTLTFKSQESYGIDFLLQVYTLKTLPDEYNN